MNSGLQDLLPILQSSPHDRGSPESRAEETSREASEGNLLVPSRYTVRAATQEGKLVLWNTYNGSISVFQKEQRKAVEALLTLKGTPVRSKGLTKYLQRRGFLIKQGVNEYQKFQLNFGRNHYRSNTLDLILLASEDCNFRCTYCYEKFARGTMLPEVRQGIKNLLRRRSSELSSFSASWFGGEPLYGFEAIADLAPFFLKFCNEKEIHFHSSMTTNGFLLTPEIAEKLLAWKIDDYQITLDGPPESHDCSRPTRNGLKTFEVIFGNLKKLSRRNEDYNVTLRVNFDQNNHPQVAELLDRTAVELRQDPRFQFRFMPVGRWGGPNDAKLAVCGSDEQVRIKQELQKEASKRGLLLKDSLKTVNKMGSQVCYAARPYNFLIGASGKVMKCTVVLDTEDHNVIGKVTPEGSLELEEDKLARWTAPSFEHDTQCQKCIVLPMCQGISCPLPRIRDNQRSCIEARAHWKSELLTITDTSTSPRTVST